MEKKIKEENERTEREHLLEKERKKRERKEIERSNKIRAKAKRGLKFRKNLKFFPGTTSLGFFHQQLQTNNTTIQQQKERNYALRHNNSEVYIVYET